MSSPNIKSSFSHRYISFPSKKNKCCTDKIKQKQISCEHTNPPNTTFPTRNISFPFEVVDKKFVFYVVLFFPRTMRHQGGLRQPKWLWTIFPKTHYVQTEDISFSASAFSCEQKQIKNRTHKKEQKHILCKTKFTFRRMYDTSTQKHSIYKHNEEMLHRKTRTETYHLL